MNSAIAPIMSDAAEAWTDDVPLVCVADVPEAPGVATFSFRAETESFFKYRAGQFITLELSTPSGPVYRTYTLSSSPSRPLSISVTVKAQADSIGTQWMLDHQRPGMRLIAKGPAGEFALPNFVQEDTKYLFISAGSGVTPSLSMTRYLYDRGQSPDICFINCARRPSEIIARDAIETMASRLPGLQLHFVVEENDPYSVWTGYRGMINQIMFGLMSPDYLEREVFCCGPEPFMKAVRDILVSLGFDMSRYHQESFGAPEDAEPVETEVADAETSINVTFENAGKTEVCSQADTILEVAKRCGENISSGCNFGLCSTCKVRKVSGEVQMVHNGGISEQEIADGMILACCSKPIGNVVVRT